MAAFVSELFDPETWTDVPGFEELTDVTYHQDRSGRIARIAFNRPEVRNAFRPHTVDELYRALDDARQNPRIGVVLLTGNGPSPKDGGWAFCSGGDQRIRGRDGYRYSNSPVAEPVEGADGEVGPSTSSGTGGSSGIGGSSGTGASSGTDGSAQIGATGRLHILEVQRLIRFMPKVVIAVIPG